MTAVLIKTVHDECTEEILRLMREHDAQAQIAADVLPIKRALNAALIEACMKHKRVLAFQAGEKIEPVDHKGEVVLQPVGGLR